MTIATTSEQGHHGNGRNVETERRLTILEQGQGHLFRRMDIIDSGNNERLSRERDRDQILAQTVTKMQRLMKDVADLSAVQQRFLIGAVACLGGVVISILRAKIGL